MRQFVFLLFVGLSACPDLSGQIVVDGMHTCYDGREGTFLVTLPDQQWGKDWQAWVALDDHTAWWDVQVNNQPVDTLVTFEGVTPGKTYPVTAMSGDCLVSAQLEFTSLPILHLQGEFGNEKSLGAITLQVPGDGEQQLLAEVKWRGYTTNQPDKHKRNYKLSFVDKKGKKNDLQFFGLRRDNSWVLDAGQTDLFRMRNLIAAKLWDDFATKPYYADKEEDVHTSSRGEIVEMFLNDEYVGIYYITEPMNNRQLYLEKYDRNAGIIHGELWKTHHYTKAVAFWDLNGSFNNLHDTWEGFETKYPDFSDDEAIDYGPLYDAIHFAVNSNSQQFNARAEEFFDVPVLINYIVLLQVFKAQDNECTNTYWFCPDQTVNKRLSLAVWDLDATCGMPQEPNKLKPEVLRADVPLSLHHGAYAGLLKNSSPYRERVWQRYKELRNSVLNSDSIVERYWAYYKLFKDCGAVKREQQRWNHDSDIFGAELNMESEIIAIDKWLRMRLEFLDQHMMEKIIDLENND